MVAKTKENLTVVTGSVDVLKSENSKLEILHKAAASLNTQDFRIKCMRIFENPLTAEIELENLSEHKSILTKFIRTANQAFKNVEQHFLITLSLSDYRHRGENTKMIYSIKRSRGIGRNLYSDETTIEVARKMQDQLLSSVNNNSVLPLKAMP